MFFLLFSTCNGSEFMQCDYPLYTKEEIDIALILDLLSRKYIESCEYSEKGNEILLHDPHVVEKKSKDFPKKNSSVINSVQALIACIDISCILVNPIKNLLHVKYAVYFFQNSIVTDLGI